MNNLNIVLVEPQIPQNTGNISRTCAVTGARLHLVRPLGFEVTDKNLKRAGLDYWNELDITYYDNLADFFSKNNGSFYYFTTKGKNVYSNINYPDNCYIVFGREDAGLPEPRAEADAGVSTDRLQGYAVHAANCEAERQSAHAR